MGNFLSSPITWVDGGPPVVNAANLQAHVDDCIIKPTAISALTLKDPLTGAEEVMVNDAGVLKKAAVLGLTSAAVPPGVMVEYGGSTAPAGWLLCFGQLVSRTTYSALFSAIGTTHGAGDGTTTFAIPDHRGRVVAGKDNMGGTSANRMTGGFGPNGDTLGAVGGSESVTLNTNQIAQHSHFMLNMPIFTGGSGIAAGTGYVFSPSESTFSGANGAHSNTQPTIMENKIIKT